MFKSKFVILSSIIASSMSLIACSNSSKGGQSTTEQRNSNRDLESALDRAETESDLFSALDKFNPRHWSNLTKTGEKEVASTFFKLRSEQEDRVSLEGLLMNALVYASVNDAIDEDKPIVDILEPELSATLGHGRDGGNAAKRMAQELSTLGTGENGIFTSYNEFRKAFGDMVRKHQSGR